MSSSFGVYVHIPFCRSRCGYCAFATWTDRHHLEERYLAAVRTDLERSGLGEVTSIFVGGGTPTLVDPRRLMDVLSVVPLVDGGELTIECNPDDIDDEMMRIFAEGGVTRVSLGVQSMAPHVLAALDRHHDPTNVGTAVSAARRAGVEQINLDLIYGAAGETLGDWRRTLDAAIELGPTHVSAYALTVEAGTPLAARPDLHPDDDDLADKYELADELLTAAGLQNYEVSNWASPGAECRHNLLYWDQGDYLGVGCAAHSHRSGRRWWNLRTPDRYIEAVESGVSCEAASEELDEPTRRLERLQLALRLRQGIPATEIDLEGLDGLLEPAAAGHVRLTRSGRLLANAVSMHLRPGPV